MREALIKGMPYGLSNRGNTTMLSQYEMSDCLNIDLTRYGLPTTRGGSSKLYGTPLESGAMINGGTEFKDYDGFYHIVVACNGKLFYDQSIDRDTIDIGFAQLGAGLTLDSDKDTFFSWTTATENNYSPILIGTDGENELFGWKGKVDGVYTDVEEIVSPVSGARAVEWFNNYLLVGNYKIDGIRYASRLCWSDLRSPTTISGQDDIFVGSADDPIVVMTKALRYIAILKEDSLWRLEINRGATSTYTPADTDPVPFVLEHIASGVGCVAPNGAAVYENFVYFQAKDGLYRWDVRGTDEDSVQKIDTKIDIDNIDWDQVNRVAAVAYPRKGQIRFWIPEEWDDVADKEKSWFYSIHHHLNDDRRRPMLPSFTRNKLKANVCWQGRDIIARNRLPVELPMIFGDNDNTPYLFVGTYDGYVLKVDTPWYNDYGEAYESYVTTGDLNLNTSRRKTMNQAHVTAGCPIHQNCDMTITQYTDFGNIASAEATFDFTNSGNNKTVDMILGGHDRYTKLKFYTYEASHGFSLSSFVVGFDITA